MYSIGSVMTLKPGAYAGYKKAHDEIWPDLAEVISAAGVSMVIYKHGDTLFVHGTAPTEEDWRKVRDKAELEDFRFHDLRHSCASYLAMNGATTAEIAAVLGRPTPRACSENGARPKKTPVDRRARADVF